jgi:hypothetical protein
MLVLRDGLTVEEMAARAFGALERFRQLEPSMAALGEWFTGPYREALAGRAHGPFSLRTTVHVGEGVHEVQTALERARLAAFGDDDFVHTLPPRVHVVHIRDRLGACGFAPIDRPGAPLAARVLSLLLTDYLSHPARYVARRNEFA